MGAPCGPQREEDPKVSLENIRKDCARSTRMPQEPPAGTERPLDLLAPEAPREPKSVPRKPQEGLPQEHEDAPRDCSRH